MDDHICGCPTEQQLFSNTVNVSEPERFASTIAGGFLIALGMGATSKCQRVSSLLMGGALIYRGVSGHCLMYHLLGKSKRQELRRTEAQIDEAGEESFPASDPPAFTAAAASPSRRE